MSLEWARARALQNEARIRALAKSGGRKEWTEVALTSAPPVTVWVEPARVHPEVPATDLSPRRQIASQVLNRENSYE
jgi:hypothetical protein